MSQLELEFEINEDPFENLRVNGSAEIPPMSALN